MSRPTLIKFYLEHNEDEEITCFFCKRARCELSFVVYGDGETRIVGAHAECAEHHEEREHKKLEKKNGNHP